MASTLVWISYPLCVAAVLAFGALACLVAWRRQKLKGADDLDFFVTARKSVSTFTIAWSFYAAAMGSWALFGPPSYALYAGILGIAMYAFASGIPIIVVAFFGTEIQKRMPNVQSLSDYVKKRFGPWVQLYIALLMLFNMSIAIIAEYTAFGDLFEFVLGTKRVPIVIIIGVVSTIYTAYGGLHASIITDQWQAFVSVIVIAILTIYVGVTFDSPLPKPLPGYLRASSYAGLSSIAVMPISLISATIFSEAMWQRCWASASDRQLKIGAVIGAIATIIAVFLFGFAGFLAVWGGVYVPSEDDSGNTILFTLLGNKTWILVIVSVLSVTMSESAVDSIQNAITDSLATTFVTPYFGNVRLIWVRLLTLVFNVPYVIISLQGYNVLQLFLLANLLTTTSTIPIMLGLWRGPLSRKVVTPFSCIVGCLVGLASLFWWGIINQQDEETYKQTLHRVFIEAYDYPPFMLALGFSLAGLLFGALLEYVFRRVVPGFEAYPVYELEDKANVLPYGLDKNGEKVSENKEVREVPTTF